MSVRSDGVTLTRSLSSNWKVFARKKPEADYSVWLASKQERLAGLPQWAREIKSLPSLAQIQHWSFDSVCETTDGIDCEPDSPATAPTDPHG
jgi:hypothetical protein